MTTPDPFSLIAKIHLDEAVRSRDAARSLSPYPFAAGTMAALRTNMRRSSMNWRRACGHIRRTPGAKAPKLADVLVDIGATGCGISRREMLPMGVGAFRHWSESMALLTGGVS
jgi:hypothetical protein